ncbi:hypothetical protein CGZ96_15930 [Enemella evansiae]|nr:hypothetical protein CGZ96_15930 [Enemella evansiae]OYO06506.1 hypothetical protein CGZ97_07785 [Enemella evansiae]
MRRMMTAVRHRHGVRPGQARETNVESVLRRLIAHGPMSRRDLARALGLSQSGMTRVVAPLTEAGLLTETEAVVTDGRRGRRQVPITIDPEQGCVAGVHLGAEHVSVALCTLGGDTLTTGRVGFDGTPRRAVEAGVGEVGRLAAGLAPLRGVGVITGGWVDSRSGVVREHRLLDWHDVPLRAEFQELLVPQGIPVVVEAASQAHALADLMFGLTGSVDSFLHVFVGNIVEASVVAHGAILARPDGFGSDLWDWPVPDRPGATAGSTLTDGCVVASAQDRGILASTGTFDDLVQLARAEEADGEARGLLADRARRVGELVAPLAAVTGSPMVVASSGVVAIEDQLADVAAGLAGGFGDPDTLPTVISGAFGPASVGRAAAACVIDDLLADPLGNLARVRS